MILHKKLLATLLGLMVSLVGIYIYWANTYGFDPWSRISARVTVDGAPLEAQTYARRGLIAIALREGDPGSSPETVYTFNPAEPVRVYWGGYYHRRAFGRLWIKPGGSIGLPLIPGGHVKTEVDPKIRFTPGRLEFTTIKLQRLKVDY